LRWLGTISLAAFVALSVIARVWQGSWLSSAGAVTTDAADSVAAYTSDVAALEGELLQARATIDDLRQRVSTDHGSAPAATMERPDQSDAGPKE